MTPFYFCDHLPFKEDFLLPKDDLTKFDLIWHAGTGEDDFSKNSVNLYSFAIIPP
jgi:hypothetical protein